MLFNELARQASECFAFLSRGVRPRNVAFREFCILAGSIISQEPSAAQEYKRGPRWMDSLFVLIQIVNVPLCWWELRGYQTLPPSISTFSSFSTSRRRTLSHPWRRGNPSSSVSNTLSSRRELLLRPVATFPPPPSPETAPRRGEGRVQLRCGCSDSPFYSSTTMSTMSTTMSTTLSTMSTSSSTISRSLAEGAIEGNLKWSLLFSWPWKWPSSFAYMCEGLKRRSFFF